MRPAALLADLDGTLVSLNPPREELEALRAELTALAADHRIALRHHGIFKIYGTLVGSASGSGFGSAAAAAQAREVIDRYEVDWSRNTATALLSADAAAALEQAAIPTALVTNNGSACVSALVDTGKLRLPHCVAITRDDGYPPKPAPDVIGAALKALQVEGGPIHYLGDSAADSGAVEAYGDPSIRLTLVAGDAVNAALLTLLETS